MPNGIPSEYDVLTLHSVYNSTYNIQRIQGSRLKERNLFLMNTYSHHAANNQLYGLMTILYDTNYTNDNVTPIKNLI